jgi:hypothetical protein
MLEKTEVVAGSGPHVQWSTRTLPQPVERKRDMVDQERPMLVDFSAGTLGAPHAMLDIDVAELLVACTVLVGAERALQSAVAAGWEDSIARVLPYLQRAALTPHLRDLARGHDVSVDELRSAAARVAGTEPPELFHSGGFVPKTSCSWPPSCSPRTS